MTWPAAPLIGRFFYLHHFTTNSGYLRPPNSEKNIHLMQNEVSFASERQVKKGSFDRGLKLTKFILLPKASFPFVWRWCGSWEGKQRTGIKRPEFPVPIPKPVDTHRKKKLFFHVILVKTDRTVVKRMPVFLHYPSPMLFRITPKLDTLFLKNQNNFE